MTTEEWRAVQNIVKRWTVLVGFAVMVGGLLVPVAVWAITTNNRLDNVEKRLTIVESGIDDARATFRIVCVTASDSIKAAAGADCPSVYPARRRRP